MSVSKTPNTPAVPLHVPKSSAASTDSKERTPAKVRGADAAPAVVNSATALAANELTAQQGMGGSRDAATATGELGTAPVGAPTGRRRSVPVAGTDAGSVASANGPTSRGGSAWTPEWEQRFTTLMKSQGQSKTAIQEQLSEAQGMQLSEEQLQAAYTSMEGASGSFDAQWKARFEKMFDQNDVPKEQRAQAMQQLQTGGLDDTQLQQAYDQMEANKPAWNDQWETKFETLELPDEMLTQLKESGAPEEALDQQFQKLLDTKMQYHEDGRLDDMLDADATPEEKWGVMLQGTEGEDFDKALEGIKSAHVSGWERAASIGVNLIPGVYAAQFLTGKDWITGEKIDRSNPMNIIGAVGSGFAGFTAVRGAMAGVKGLTAANAAFKAGSASSGLTSAAESASLLPKFQQGLKFTDYLKAATPGINRFGEAGRLSAVGKGYTQGMQLTAGSAALKTTAEGGAVVDKAAKARVLSELQQGKTAESALASIGRTEGTAGGYAVRAQDVARDANRYGYLQGGVGKLGEGNKLMRGSGNFRFNPFANTASIGSTANPNVMSLGRGVNFGSTGGLAQGMGAARGANAGANAGLYAQAAERMAANSNPLITKAGPASRITGLGIGDDVVRAETAAKTAQWAQKLGVTDGNVLRRLTQLGASNRAAARTAGVVEHGGNAGYRAARHAGDLGRRYAGMAATPLVGGAMVGMTGKQVQPGWEYLKDIKEIRAEQAKANKAADREAKQLERLYQQEHGGGAAPTNDAAAGAMQAQGMAPSTPAPTGMAPAPAPTASPAGSTGGVIQDPNTGMYVDTATGMMVDPSTGQVLDPAGNVVGNVADMAGQAGM